VADYSVLSQGVRPFNALGAIQGGQQIRANNMLMQQQQQEQAREQQYNSLLSDYLGQSTVNTLTGQGGMPPGAGMEYAVPGGGSMPAQAPPVDINQLYAMDPRRTAQLQQFQQAQQAAVQAQQTEEARRAVSKAQFVLASKEPGQLVKTAFPEVWQQLTELGDDPESFTPEKWREEAEAMLAHYGPIAGVGPAGQGEQFTLGEGQTRFDANGNPIASVAPAPSDKDPNDKNFQRATTLRKEYDSERASFDTMRSAWENVQGATEGDAGDTQLVLNYMRLISPGIRLQPGQAIDDAASVPGVSANVIGAWNKLVNGGKLRPSDRADMKQQARTTFNNQKKLADEARKKYGKLAELYGVDAVQVIGEEPKDLSATPVQDFAKLTDEELQRIANGG
jgi:hypothetical protein